MHRVRGTILSIRDSDAGRIALVDVPVAAVCKRCAEGRGCGAGIFGSRQANRQIEANLMNGDELAKGDRVSVDLGPGSLIRAAAIAYGWPLIGAAAGAAIGLALSTSETAAIILTLAGLACGIGFARARLMTRQCIAGLAMQAAPLDATVEATAD